MISAVIPFYKKLFELKFSFLNYNLSVFKDDVQLVIVCDDPHGSDGVVSFVKTLDLPTKVLLNEKSHEWRNPAKPLNVGIKHSDGEKILVMSPESCFWNKNALENLDIHCTSHSFTFGDIKFCTYQEYKDLVRRYGHSVFVYDNINSQTIDYGSICFMKEHAVRIGGYDGSRGNWGGENDNFRNRLEKAGIMRVKANAHLVHFQENLRSETAKKINTKFPGDYYEWRDNSMILANPTGWGNDFDKIIFERS